MEKVHLAERYVVTIDSAVTTKDELFSRITDTAYLGYSSFSGWDAFWDMLHGRLETSDILIEIVNEDLSGLSERDRQSYLDIMAEAVREFPQKLLLR
jgi:RNAse (barnase) inhibitor barstar